MVLIYQAPQAAREAAARDINGLLAANSLKHQYSARYALEQIVPAHEAVESGKGIGKVLIDIAAP
jgi:NADPH2:quinone reductase